MKRSLLLPAAYLVDHFAGDPEWLPHPVRLIGFAISTGEAYLRRPRQSSRSELIAGAALTLAIVGATYWSTATVVRYAYGYSVALGNTVELALSWTCLAARNLEQEAISVTSALRASDLPLARKRLSRIVGRDTATLDTQEISRAVIETVAESASDGTMAPLFYMALGGVPLAMAYKAVNTLDSMIGHADGAYFYFGRAAARLDDAANYLPARLSAFAIVAAANMSSDADARAAFRTWQRDGSCHKSPNAGQPESAIAGALHVALGGDNTYAGERIPARRIGGKFPAPTPVKANEAIRLITATSLLGLAIGVALTCLIPLRERR